MQSPSRGRAARQHLRLARSAARSLRKTLQELSPFILHSDFQLFRLARFCVARLALNEVHTGLPDLHVLKGVFRATGLQPGFPTFAQFCRQSVLYLRFSPVKRYAKLFYVGSTEGCTSIREASRYRKYKQVQQDKLVSAELCLRYWDRDSTFWEWVAVPISAAVPPNILRGRKQAMTQTLQPLLNFPFIAQWFCPKKGIQCIFSQADWLPAHPSKTSKEIIASAALAWTTFATQCHF